MIKEKYNKISFPFEKKDPDSVISLYLLEFGKLSTTSLNGIKLIFAHALRDYLESKVGEWELGSLCFALMADKSTRKIMQSDKKLNSFISDCVDILWLSDSENFDDYKKDLQKYLEDLKEEI